jgi:3-dehydroquinate synthase
VDSSVGGKTGVDLRAGKNLAGAFKQPSLVLADIETLASLPESEWRSGLAEIAKSAVIDSEEFLGWTEANASRLLARDSEVVAEAVARCVMFKSGVVSSDEREEGMRECLNYGHTLGHALENVAGYGTVPHGLAVAEGMRFAVRVAVEVAGASRDFVRRQDALLDSLGLPALAGSWPPYDLHNAMRSDKKARSGDIRFVLADSPGSWSCTQVDDSVLQEHLDAWAGSKRGD